MTDATKHNVIPLSGAVCTDGNKGPSSSVYVRYYCVVSKYILLLRLQTDRSVGSRSPTLADGNRGVRIGVKRRALDCLLFFYEAPEATP